MGGNGTLSFVDEKENLYAIQSYRLLIDVGHMYEKKLFIKLLLDDVQKIHLLTLDVLFICLFVF